MTLESRAEGRRGGLMVVVVEDVSEDVSSFMKLLFPSGGVRVSRIFASSRKQTASLLVVGPLSQSLDRFGPEVCFLATGKVAGSLAQLLADACPSFPALARVARQQGPQSPIARALLDLIQEQLPPEEDARLRRALVCELTLIRNSPLACLNLETGQEAWCSPFSELISIAEHVVFFEYELLGRLLFVGESVAAWIGLREYGDETLDVPGVLTHHTECLWFRFHDEVFQRPVEILRLVRDPVTALFGTQFLIRFGEPPLPISYPYAYVTLVQGRGWTSHKPLDLLNPDHVAPAYEQPLPYPFFLSTR